ncbi:Glycosyltransferase involved in cell wall bisynthesis [Desulfuromusa kysingii]|uniref:Glycosyltransferase involved in cell wall bisynthesis n=1 Tax=Desulfuromusa kysingii TaxID=37625 RepID=A0A1H4BAL0_9BACT|nr:glycosyltransferase [Desulfuromusa kysingii]SEA45147.1 Glycosyltransferase involved in cell wall bisynthesis [Desulfuromusa kysingii]
MKKVVHLIASSGLYGAEKWVLALMRAIDTSLFSCTLVNLYDAAEGQSAVVAGALERDLDAIDFYTRGSFNPLSIIRLSRWFKQNHIEIVHGHGYKSDIIGLLAGRLAGCKVISTPHGWTKNPGKKLQFYEWLDCLFFQLMDAVCPLSEELLKGLKGKIPSRKLRYILNGVDIDEIDQSPLSIMKKDNEYIIGYIGRLIDDKDIPTLIRAFKMLTDSPLSDFYFFKLYLIGEGPALPELECLVEQFHLAQQVKFSGYRSDATSFLKCFDILVLPSLSEGVPRCIMEALAAKVPVVASDIPGNRVLIKHEITGTLFKTGDEEALFLILKRHLENCPMCYNTVNSGRILVQEKFSNVRMAREYALVYTECLANLKNNSG